MLETPDPVTIGLLERADAQLAEGAWENALAATEEACRRSPKEPDARLLLGLALAGLDRLEEAQAAFAAALELGGDELEVLHAAAELAIGKEGDDPERLEAGLVLAQKGCKLAKRKGELEFEGEFLLLLGVGESQRGDPRAALSFFEEARERLGDDPELLLERGLALFECCKFEEARRALEALLEDAPDEPVAHHYLARLAERRGEHELAARHFEQATRLAPDEFPTPVRLTAEAFDEVVERALAELPEKVRRYLGNVAIAVEDLPPDDDLIGNEPPLSPTILGIFRGSPWRDKGTFDPWAHFPSSIVLYQRNLERIARDHEELIEEIGVTLLHEVGHFLGFDEDDLRERGLD